MHPPLHVATDDPPAHLPPQAAAITIRERLAAMSARIKTQPGTEKAAVLIERVVPRPPRDDLNTPTMYFLIAGWGYAKPNMSG